MGILVSRSTTQIGIGDICPRGLQRGPVTSDVRQTCEAETAKRALNVPWISGHDWIIELSKLRVVKTMIQMGGYRLMRSI